MSENSRNYSAAVGTANSGRRIGLEKPTLHQRRHAKRTNELLRRLFDKWSAE